MFLHNFFSFQPDQWEEYYQQKYCTKPPGEPSSSSAPRYVTLTGEGGSASCLLLSRCSLPGHRRMSQGPIIPTEALAITKPKRRRIEDPKCTSKDAV